MIDIRLDVPENIPRNKYQDNYDMPVIRKPHLIVLSIDRKYSRLMERIAIVETRRALHQKAKWIVEILASVARFLIDAVDFLSLHLLPPSHA
jgi:hypothetical protein